MYFKHEWRKSEWFKNLTKQETQIILYLNNFADKDGKTDISQSELKEFGKLSRVFIKKWVQKLEQKNLLEVTRNSGKNNFYTLKFYIEPVNDVYQLTTFTSKRESVEPVNVGDVTSKRESVEPVNVGTAVYSTIRKELIIRKNKENNIKCAEPAPAKCSRISPIEIQPEIQPEIETIEPSDDFKDFWVQTLKTKLNIDPVFTIREKSCLDKIKTFASLEQFKTAVSNLFIDEYFKERTLYILNKYFERFLTATTYKNSNLDTSQNCNNTQWQPQHIGGIKL